MKLTDAIKKLSCTEAITKAKKIAEKIDLDWDNGVRYIFDVIVNDHTRIPGNIGGSKDSEDTLIEKWLKKYKSGKENCASVRVSNLPSTVADPVIEKIIGSRLTNLSEIDLSNITDAHRLGMSAENILGLMLEEYLSKNLQNHGWHCAWGETIKSVDFVNENGKLLQIKNRSNSENSSSSTVRSGTDIQKWYRIKADKVEYMWDDLNKICGTENLSEETFVKFVKETILKNPKSLAIEDNNFWLLTKS